jgi:hypothetical protein
MLLTSVIQDVSGLPWLVRDRNARPIEKSKGLKPWPEPKQRAKGFTDGAAGKASCGLKEAIPQEGEDHEGIRAGRKGRGGVWSAGTQFGDYGELRVHGGGQGVDVLPCCAGVNATQHFADLFRQSRLPFPFE